MAVNIVTGMTGIEHITSHDDRARNASQFGRGKYVFNIGRKFSATAVDDNLVRIQDGMCINQGTQMGIEPNDYADVEIDNGLLGTNRHDIIVMRYEKNEETLLEKASLAVVKGVNSSEPVDPEVTEGNILDGGDLVDDMPLYRVVIEGVNLVSIEPLFEVFDGDVGSILEELEDKVDKVTGKGLSTNDYTNEDKTKLDGIDTGAEVNVQSDWSQNDNTADDFIKHKPGIPSKTSDLQNDSDFVSDANYVHTDNNYTNADKEDVKKIDDIENISVLPASTVYEVTSIALYGGGMVEALNNESAISISVGDYIYAKNDISKKFNFGYEVTKTLKAGYYRVKSVYSNGHAVICAINSSTVPDPTYGIVAITELEKSLVIEKMDIDGKVDKVDGKGLSANDYTDAEKEDVGKIDTLETNQTQILSDIEDLERSLSTTLTATGNPISISDSAHVNAEKLTVELEPIQSGSGDPSPENIRPISGYDETSVVRSGKNLLLLTLENLKASSTEGTWNGNVYTNGSVFTVNTDSDGNVVSIDGKAQSTGGYIRSSFTLKAGTYILTSGFSEQNGANDTFLQKDGTTIARGNEASPGQMFTLSEDSTVVWNFRVTNADKTATPMIRLASESDSTYEPYTADTYTLQFGDTVYGAEVDFVRGVATVTHGYIAEYAGETLPSTWISDRDVYASGTTPTTGAEVVYELATPTTIQLTPQQIKMLKGNNVLVADGDMNLSYQVDSVVGDVKEWAEEHFIPYNTYRTPPVYGFHIDGNNSDPSSRVTYIADNANYTPAYMDYTANKFRYNSWQDAWFIKYCKPCILNQDGTVKAYLNPNDYTKDVDGNTVVIDENLTDANVMIEFPEIWYKGVPDAGDTTSASVYFSPVKVDEDYKDYAYIDKDGVHKKHFYMPAYNGSVLSETTVMRSISGQAVSKNLDVSTEIAYAKANGDGWFTEDAGEAMLINFLLILIGKSTDTQTVFGRGIDNGGETAFNNYVTGAGNLKGLFYGTNTGTGLVKVFGIENWWGLQWRRYAGDVLDNGVRKVKLCYGNEDGSTTFDFNIDGTGYVDVGATPSGTNGGYIRTMKFTHDGMYSAISDGSSSTYYCDGQWFNNTYHTIYALRGGDSGGSVRCGAFCVDLVVSPGYRGWSAGAAVSYK